MLASTVVACPVVAREAVRRRSARARRRRGRSRRGRRRTRTPCRCRSTHTHTRMHTRILRTHTPTRRSTTPRDCAPRKRTSPHTGVPVLMAVGHRSLKASVAVWRVPVLSTSAPTASYSRTTRVTSPPSLTTTSLALSPSTNLKRPCPWRRAICPRRFSTRRRRGPRAPDSSCMTTTPGTSTTRATGTHTATPPSTTRLRRTITWRPRATAACCWAAARCTRSTSPWTGRMRTRTPRTTRTRTMPRRISTPPPARPTPTRRLQVWRRRCRTRRRICTGSSALDSSVPMLA